jgi:P4 family phage/plasmid primase-like protien
VQTEIASQTITVTLGRGAKKSTGLNPTAYTLSDLFERLATHEIGPKDNAECIVPGIIAPCPSPCLNHGRTRAVDCGGGKVHRLNSNVKELHALFVDLDGLDVDALMRLVTAVEASGYVFACYSTPSYAPPVKANARFVFPLAEPVPAGKWKQIWAQLVAQTGIEGADQACCDPSRLYYLPTKPTADAPTFVRQGGEKLLSAPLPKPLQLVPANAAPHEIISALRAEADYQGDIDLVERIAKGAALSDDVGGRHLAILRATMLLKHVGAKSIDVLVPSLNALGGDRDFIGEAERAFDTAPVEDPPEVVAFRERLEEQSGTDRGFAKRFARLYSDQVRYVPEVGWHVWSGAVWQKCVDAPFHIAAELSKSYETDHTELKTRIAELQEHMRQAPSKHLADKLNRLMEKESKFHKRLITPPQNTAPAAAFMRAATKELETSAEEFDVDPWALNCTNGIIDLKTGMLKPHDPAAMCIKQAATAYISDARAPLFERTLETALPDPDVRGFFQRVMGYALTGVMSEDLIFVMLGSGGNGKSTLLNAVAHALGDYAGPAPKSLLMSSKVPQTYELADLRGRRLVTMMELSQREYMDSSRLKSAVGGDRIIAARKYENQVAFTTQAKIFMPCNQKPRLNDDDDGAWRRIALIEFPVAFLTDDVRDRSLPAALMNEAEGILAWAVRGCLEWQRGGLQVPEVSKRNVAEYRHEENYIARFVEDRVERGDGTTTSARLYDAYREWAQGEGIFAVAQSAFGKKLKKLGFESYRTDTCRMWRGVKSLIV